MRTNKPYIGITGFMSSDEVRAMLRLMPPIPPIPPKRLLMVGVLASTTTLNGERPSKFFGRYPVVEAIRDIFVDHFLALNLIHFNDKTKDNKKITEQLSRLTEIAGRKLDGFQLNIKWPASAVIDAYRREFPDKTIVLQVGTGAFRAVDSSPAKMAARVKEYDGLIDYVLFDPSGGSGTEFDPVPAKECLDALCTLKMDIGMGPAGGLSAKTLPKLVAPLVDLGYKDICIDAEGKLRNKQDDSLNLEWSGAYVAAADTIFGNQ